MNKGTVFGKHIYIAYKRTDSKTEAIKELAIFDGKNPSDSRRINIGNNTTVRFDLVAHIDLNTGAGGDYLYLYATTNSAAGEPIRALRSSNKTLSSTSGGFTEYTVKRADSNGFNHTSPDLNDGVAGKYIYLIAKKATPSSTGSLFGNGSWIAITVLTSAAIAFAVIVYVKKKRNGASTNS